MSKKLCTKQPTAEKELERTRRTRTHKLTTKHNGINEFESHVSTGCTLPFQSERYKLCFTLFHFGCGQMRCCRRRHRRRRRRRRCHFSISACWLLGGCFWRVSVSRSHYSVYVCVFLCVSFSTTHISNPNERERVEERRNEKNRIKKSEPSISNGLQTRNKTFKINDKYLYDINMYAVAKLVAPRSHFALLRAHTVARMWAIRIVRSWLRSFAIAATTVLCRCSSLFYVDMKAERPTLAHHICIETKCA